jgi:selenocysteine lyase/cysteine desulfurase
LSAVVRASVSAHTTDADIQALVQALQALSAAPAR